MFVVSGDVLQLRETDGFGADEGSNPLRIFAALENAAVAHDHRVDVGVHLGVDEGDVVNQVNAAVSDRFDRGGTAAVHTWSGREGKSGVSIVFWEKSTYFKIKCMYLKS